LELLLAAIIICSLMGLQMVPRITTKTELPTKEGEKEF